jgi:CO/xanthine dehydrogenase Mo-binding subunit
MDSEAPQVALSRREVVQSLGALVVVAPAAFAADGSLAQESAMSGTVKAPLKPALKPGELDSWLAIGKDGRVTAYFGKPDIGQGVDTAIAQIVAEELDVPLDHVDMVMGDTERTCNQGGVSGSTGVQRGAIPLRNAAAEARAVLLLRASQRLGVPVEKLRVDAGVVIALDDPGKRVGYGELVTGQFNHQLEWNGKYGNELVATGKAKPKSPDQYKLVGTSQPRREVRAKVFGQFHYIADLKRPNMLYGRVLRPAVAGAQPVSVDEASIAHIPGARVVRKNDFIGVVADHEWDAIQASRALKVHWSDAPAPFVPHTAIHEHIRKATPAKRQIETTVGNVDAAFAKGGRIVAAEYEWPFQSHASLAPACAVAEVTADGVTVWHSSQKPHAASEGIAKMLGLPVEKVHSVSVAGPGSYGRNDAGDAAADAVVMALVTGRPVRVQGARSDGHGWDPKGAASIHSARALLGADGRIEAYRFMSKGFSRAEVATAESGANDLLAGMLLGFDNPPVHSFNVPTDAYEIPNREAGWETVATMLPNASPLRTSHLRDPLGPQLYFASESFMDECAVAAGADPVEYRLRHLKDARSIAIVKAAAEKAKWTPRASGARRARGNIMTGRGFAYSDRSGTLVATIVDVEVDRKTGRVWPRRFVVAHDCGLIVNPQGLKLCIEANIVHSTSRALFEEVTFDARNVTSVDWATYPIMDIMDVPESVEVVLINHPESPPSGAGEPSTRPTAAAIANAIYDATGVRLRKAPFTRERIKAALA